MSIVVLCGGVGGSRFLKALCETLPHEDITAIVNTGDDLMLYGLRVSPDIDIVVYTLAGMINPETGLKMSDIEKLGDRDRNEHPIVIAEDSPLLERMIVDCLTQAGYTNVIPTTNGQEAWDLLMQYKEHGTLQESVSCVITDIEMPRMDGHRLTKLIKTDNEMEHIPVVIFSSLVNDQMRAKGKALGADAQLSKPEIGSLVQEIDTLIGAKAK